MSEIKNDPYRVLVHDGLSILKEATVLAGGIENAERIVLHDMVAEAITFDPNTVTVVVRPF